MWANKQINQNVEFSTYFMWEIVQLQVIWLPVAHQAEKEPNKLFLKATRLGRDFKDKLR